MPGTSSLTQQTTVRLPVDLLEWIATQSGSKADVIAGALRDKRDGPKSSDDSEWRDRALKAEAEVKRLRDLGNDRVVQAVASKPIGHHASGPILEPKVTVRGTARPMFRPGTVGAKAQNS